MDVGDFFPQGRRMWFRLHEKGGKHHEVPAHHNAEGYLDTYGADNIDFYDLTAVLKKSWILEFCHLIEERGLKFTYQLPTGTRAEAIDEEVSAALYRTGCRNITYAPESGSQETLDTIKKRVNLPRMLSSIRAALGAGLHVKCNLIIGFPHESRSHIWKTMKLCWRLATMGVHDVGVFLFSPYPGSELFETLRGEGRISSLADSYYRSLAAFMDPFKATRYCRHVGPWELAVWRALAMMSFFLVSFLLRPGRLLRLIRNVMKNESQTVLEQRLGALVRRPFVGERRRPQRGWSPTDLNPPK